MTLPDDLAANPRLSRWLGFPDGRVLVHAGKVELGQGIATALALMAAEELDVDPADVVIDPSNTRRGPNEGYTAGSLSISRAGPALRQACAEVRLKCVVEAASQLGVRPAEITISGGRLHAGGQSLSYWELPTSSLLDSDADGHATPKPPVSEADLRLNRLDLPAKLTGTSRYIGDLRPSDVLHARLVRPPARVGRLVAVDRSRALAVGASHIVVEGDFVAVLAEREEVALRAAGVLAQDCRWQVAESLPVSLEAFFADPSCRSELIYSSQGGSADAGGRETLVADYSRPYLAHASIGTSTALARWDGSDLEVWTHGQGVFPLRAALAEALELAEQAISVQHVEHAGCYGHNGADDAAYDAAVLALAVPKRTVRVVWSRQDELGWSPLGPAMRVRIEAETDASGRVRAWRHDLWSNGHTSRPGSPGGIRFLSHSLRHPDEPVPIAADPPLSGGGGSTRNSVPGYSFDAVAVTAHRPPTMPLRTSAMRGLGAHLNVFAIECFLDELAERARRDPLEFRLAHLDDPRGRRVLEAVAEAANWGAPMTSGQGLGLAYARYKNVSGYCAVVARVEAIDSLRIVSLTLAVDVGRDVDRDGVINQVEGGAIQAASWTTLEQVGFDTSTVISDTWETYPIMRFTQVPQVSVQVLSSVDPSLGAGEISTGPTAAALGNAVAAAVGVRVRDLPINREAIIAAINR